MDTTSPPERIDLDDPAVSGTRRPSRVDLSTVREASWFTLLAVILAASALTAGLWYLISLPWQPLVALEAAAGDATAGLVQLTLLLNVFLLLVVVVGLVGWLGGLRPADLGLDRADLRTGVVVTLASWLVLQAVGVASLVAQGQPVAVNSYWTAGSALAVIGIFVAQLFGNALYEEVVYRAFLVNQFRHKLARALPTATPRRVLLVAILVSQLVFALIHVPARLVTYQTATIPGSLLTVFVLGVLLAVLYYRTGNLFVAVGLHAFLNAPTMVFGSPEVGMLAALVLVVLLAVAWPWVESYVAPAGGAARSAA